MDKGGLTERFKQFCASLSAKDSIGVIYHCDADGFASALVTAKAIESLTGKRPSVIRHYEYGNMVHGRKAVESLEKAAVNTLIVLDIGIDSAPHSLQDKYRFEKCLVIDHHKMYKDLNSEKMVFLKAQFFTEKDPSSYVTAKFAFDLFNQVSDVSGLDWAACIGIIGDMNLRNWRLFVQKTIEKRGLSLTLLYNLVDLIASVEVLATEKLTELFWLFYNAETPERVLDSGFKRYLQEFKREKDQLVEGFKEKAEKIPELELYFYAIKARHENIKSHVINEISEMHPDKTIILMQYLGSGRVRVSARRQDFKVRVNDLLVAAVEGIPDSTAGGHAPAAAGSVPKQYASRFKENVVGILEKKYG